MAAATNRPGPLQHLSNTELRQAYAQACEAHRFRVRLAQALMAEVAETAEQVEALTDELARRGLRGSTP